MKVTEILGIKIDPRKENLVQVLVEERQMIKSQEKNRAQAIKILVNSMSYEIFIELNPEDKKRAL